MSSTDLEKSYANDEKVTPNLERRLMTPFLSKKVPPIPRTKEERKPYQRFKSFFLMRILWWWVHPILHVGYKRTLDPNDLFYLTEDMSIEYNHKIFKQHLNDILEKNKQKHLKKNPKLTKAELANLPYPKLAILKALFKTFKYSYLSAIVYKLGADLTGVLSPLLTKALINFVEERTLNIDEKIGKGVGYAIGSALMIAVNGIFINHFLHNSLTVGAHCKAILTTELLNKSFTAGVSARHKYPPGKITSLMSTDLARVDLAIGFQPFGITFPIPVAVAIGLLIHNIGVSSLVGIGIFILSFLTIGFAMTKLLAMRKVVNQYTDGRVGLMREILQSMKMIKFYSWEDAYEKQVEEQRTKEVDIIFKMQAIRNSLLAYAVCLPNFTSMVSFLVLYAVSNNKNPGSIFASLSLMGVLANQMLMLPVALATGSDGYVGIDRVRQYLQMPDIGEDHIESVDEEIDETEEKPLDDEVAIKITDATFAWETFEDEGEDQKDETSETETEKSDNNSTILKQESSSTDVGDSPKKVFTGFDDISLTIKKGEFIIITGPIGSGKSSLLTAIAGFMTKKAGSLQTSSPLLLCGQPWVQNATVKENITFGEEFNKEWYDKILDACSLLDDLKIFPGGDLTEIGERGITLSGGQKARINMARAVYSNKDTVLFDDVLSAVDARVGKNIIDKCFLGLMAGKTRLLATHQLSLIGVADRIIFLNADGNLHVGTLSELLATEPEFVKLMEFSKKSEEKKKEEDDEKAEIEEVEELNREKSLYEGNAEEGVLIKDEERAKNQIKSSVYKEYLQAGQGIFGVFAAPLALCFLVLDIFTSIFTNVWLSFWISSKFKGRSNGFYIGIYVLLTLTSILFTSSSFVVISYICATAAKLLNLRAMRKVLHTPMKFLDTTPMGRILNRFSKDTDALDNETGEQIRLFLHPSAYIIGVLILCVIYLPWFAIAIPPLVLLFVGFTNYYQASSREVKRIEAVQRSLVYNNFNEVLNGMSTIKAYNSNHRFLKKNSESIDRMNEAYLLVIANQRWISVHLDFVGAILALVVGLLSVTKQFNISAASTGLLMTQVLQFSSLLSLILRALTQVENEMNSVERLCYYANNLEQEAPYRITETTPAPSWPENGSIEFTNVDLRYREGLPLVLKDISFKINSVEKIGICGRTGAGKSSIMTALYRLSELSSGQIKIDGVDISKLGLYDLRSKLAIIPQDPVLFQGSIRKNLDPFNEHRDDELWDALRRSGLIGSTDNVDEKEKFHLDQTVEDEGSNFSLGERQLIALSRALVRNCKILIMDEATSSVDYKTDASIQKTIATEFKDCTILCIAHRLKTILNYDRILVLEQGEIDQFGTPIELFKSDGIFKSMCERSDITIDDFN